MTAAELASVDDAYDVLPYSIKKKKKKKKKIIIRSINLLRFAKKVTSRVQRRFLNFNIFGRSK